MGGHSCSSSCLIWGADNGSGSSAGSREGRAGCGGSEQGSGPPCGGRDRSRGMGPAGVVGACLQTVCILGGHRVAVEGMVTRSPAMRDGSVQSGEAGAGAEGKDQSHRRSPREQLQLSVGGRRWGRNGGGIKHGKGGSAPEGSGVNQANGTQFTTPFSPPHPALPPEGNLELLGEQVWAIKGSKDHWSECLLPQRLPKLRELSGLMAWYR